MTVLVFYEGVLQARNKDRPIIDGYRLLRSLSDHMRIVVATSGNKDRVEHQLKVERLTDAVAVVVDESVALEPLPLWHRQIEKARSEYPLSYVVSADPAVIEWVVEHGMIGLLFAHPKHAGPHQRPIHGTKTWDALVDELEARL